MSTYGWTIEQVNDLTVQQMTALIEEIKEAHRGPESDPDPGEEEALAALSGHVVQGVPEAAPPATSKTGSKIKVFDRKTGRRVI